MNRDIKEWIADNLWHKPSNIIYRAYKRVIKFIIWFPVIWKDEDWDAVYLYEIMRFKIALLRKNMEKSARHIGYEKHVRQMKVVEELLKRAGFSNFYFDLGEKNKILEKEKTCTCPENTIEWEEGGPLGKVMKDCRCEFCIRSMRRWIKIEDLKEKNDFEYAMKIISKHSKSWWN